MNILIYLIFMAIGSLGCYFILLPKLKKRESLNENIKQENQKLDEENCSLKNDLKRNQEEYKNLIKNIQENQTTAMSLSAHLIEMQNKADEQAEEYKKKSFNRIENEIQDKINKTQKKYKDIEQQYQDEYYQTLKDAAEELSTNIFEKNNEKKQLDAEIAEKTSIISALVENAKRRFEEEHTVDFYKLFLPKEDIEEIKELRQIIPKLRNPEPLNKVIWKIYYEKPYTDLVGRVIGSEIHTGIYKITNINNEMCYVGQAVNIAERWKTHIKRGIGAEPIIANKLYPAMLKEGIENFTFEVVEECSREQLNEKEKYWQDIFKAKEFGYSIK